GGVVLRGPAPCVFARCDHAPPLLASASGTRRQWSIETGAPSRPTPASLRRLDLWKKAGITVHGRADWLFIKLHCHGMDPTQEEAMLGQPMRQFLRELVEGAEERREVLHFVSAREMVNIILAACDGREGNPGDYRDYRLKPIRTWAESVRSGSGIVLRG